MASARTPIKPLIRVLRLESAPAASTALNRPQAPPQPPADGGTSAVSPDAGRKPGKITNEKARVEILRILVEECKGFSVSMAREYLARSYGLRIGQGTLQRLMIPIGLWRPRGQRIKIVSERSARAQRRGELVRWNTSRHNWLEGRGGKLSLIYMLDDATSELTARFVRHDSTAENFRLLAVYLKRHGRPLAFQADRASLFQTAPKRRRDAEARSSTRPERLSATQIGRALRELGVGWTVAPAAKPADRLERIFRSAQTRLLEGLRAARVKRLEEANQFLEGEFLPWWNRNLTAPPSSAGDAHRPIEPSQGLPGILSVVDRRQVARDGAIRFQGKRYQIAREHLALIPRRARVRVEIRLDGSMWARCSAGCFAIRECVPQPELVASKPRPAHPRRAARRRSGWRPTPASVTPGGLPVWRAAQIDRARVSDWLD